jgi:hypothetical protein
MKKITYFLSTLFGAFYGSACVAHAEWTPLIAATDFDGIRDDMVTMVAGVVAIMLIVVGLGFLVKSLVR